MRVRNLNGTNRLHSPCGDWLSLWEQASGQRASLCSVKDCIYMPSVGGLVQRDAAAGGGWYVIPLCAACNGEIGRDLDIWDLATLVSVAATRMAEPAHIRRSSPGASRGAPSLLPEWRWE